MKPALIKSQNGSQNDNIAGCNYASPHVKESKTVLDSGLRIPGTGFRHFLRGTWILDSLVAFRIP